MRRSGRLSLVSAEEERLLETHASPRGLVTYFELRLVQRCILLGWQIPT